MCLCWPGVSFTIRPKDSSADVNGLAKRPSASNLVAGAGESEGHRKLAALIGAGYSSEEESSEEEEEEGEISDLEDEEQAKKGGL